MTTRKTVHLDNDTSVTFELPALRGRRIQVAREKRARLIQEYVMSWPNIVRRAPQLWRMYLQNGIDEATSSSFWHKADLDTMQALRLKGERIQDKADHGHVSFAGLNTSKEETALHVWPRAGGPAMPDGPLRLATGPNDYEGLGRERFWDLSEDERAAQLPAILKLVSSWQSSYDKEFGKGFLSEHQRLNACKARTRPTSA